MKIGDFSRRKEYVVANILGNKLPFLVCYFYFMLSFSQKTIIMGVIFFIIGLVFLAENDDGTWLAFLMLSWASVLIWKFFNEYRWEQEEKIYPYGQKNIWCITRPDTNNPHLLFEYWYGMSTSGLPYLVPYKKTVNQKLFQEKINKLYEITMSDIENQPDIIKISAICTTEIFKTLLTDKYRYSLDNEIWITPYSGSVIMFVSSRLNTHLYLEPLSNILSDFKIDREKWTDILRPIFIFTQSESKNLPFEIILSSIIAILYDYLLEKWYIDNDDELIKQEKMTQIRKFLNRVIDEVLPEIKEFKCMF